MATQEQYPRDEEPVSGWAVGGVTFAACVLTLIGFFQVIAGLVAVIDDDFYVVAQNYTFNLDTSAWGWIHLLIGVLLVITGLRSLQPFGLGGLHRDLPRDAERPRELLLHPVLPVLGDPPDRAQHLGDLGDHPAGRTPDLAGV